MKRFLLLTLTAGLLSPIAGEAFWKYGSMEQARDACYEWLKKGGKYKYWAWEIRRYDEPKYYSNNDDPSGKYVVLEHPKRFCRHEKATRQYLGKQRVIENNFEKGVWHTDRVKESKIKKHFRY